MQVQLELAKTLSLSSVLEFLEQRKEEEWVKYSEAYSRWDKDKKSPIANYQCGMMCGRYEAILRLIQELQAL